LEWLFYVQPNTWKVQPYIGIGLGEYFNTVTNKWGGATVYDSSGSGIGFVAKGGFRAFVSDNFFIGAYAKYFTNYQDIKYVYSNGSTITKRFLAVSSG
jgi:outer membrane protein W